MEDVSSSKAAEWWARAVWALERLLVRRDTRKDKVM